MMWGMTVYFKLMQLTARQQTRGNALRHFSPSSLRTVACAMSWATTFKQATSVGFVACFLWWIGLTLKSFVLV
jgi:hypothetical protein